MKLPVLSLINSIVYFQMEYKRQYLSSSFPQFTQLNFNTKVNRIMLNKIIVKKS